MPTTDPEPVDPGPLHRLFRPKSVAVIGGGVGPAVITQLRRLGFSGSIHPVHPKRDNLAGIPCIPRIEDLPDAPDAAFLAINRHASIPAVRALSARGAGGAIIYASGFREGNGDGADLEADLRAAAGGMPLLGPNCYGLINALDGVSLWPDEHGATQVDRGVALITQSGNIAISLTMNRRAVPIAYVVTLGNQTTVGPAEAIVAVAADPRVSAIGLYLEDIGDPHRFHLAVHEARSRGLPVIVLKAGRSAQGQRQTLSHTAAIAGRDEILSAWFEDIGVSRVTTLPVLLEALKIGHVHGALPSRRIVAAACSGGETALIADAAPGAGVELPPFPDATAAAIAETTHPLVTIGNPFDYHTFDWLAPERLHATFAAMQSAPVDLMVLMIDQPRDDRCDPTNWLAVIKAWQAATTAAGTRPAILSTLPDSMPEELATAAMTAGMVPLCGIEDALAAIAAIAAPLGRSPDHPLPPLGDGPSVSLTEAEAKARLSDYGVTVPMGHVVDTPDDAVAAAEQIGGPVVLKAVGIAHKTEHGGVRLDLRTPDAVQEAAQDLLTIGPAVLVEAMADGAIAELIVGVDRDPAIGLYIAIGAGGIWVEVAQDHTVLPLPASVERIRAAVEGLALAPVLRGARGRPAADIDAIVGTIHGIARFAVDHADRLEEMDVNPLIIRPSGHDPVAVDALIRWREVS